MNRRSFFGVLAAACAAPVAVKALERKPPPLAPVPPQFSEVSWSASGDATTWNLNVTLTIPEGVESVDVYITSPTAPMRSLGRVYKTGAVKFGSFPLPPDRECWQLFLVTNASKLAHEGGKVVGDFLVPGPRWVRPHLDPVAETWHQIHHILPLPPP